MAKISTYEQDVTVNGVDRIIGSDGNRNNATKNFSVRSLTDFINTDLFKGFEDGQVITVFNDTIIPSAIQSTFVTTVYEGTNEGNSVLATGANELTFGTTLTFTDPQVAIDSYIVVLNGTNKYTSLITGISEDNRTITVDRNFTSDELLIFGLPGGINNIATFLRYTGISIQGATLDAAVSRVNNLNPEGPLSIRTWWGTQIQYDTQFPGGVGLELDVEYTIYTPLVP